MSNILITGGSGLIGTNLSVILADKGHEIAHLTRSKKEDYTYKQFEWDIDKGLIEEGAFEFADVIIHLAGAGVADKRWTDSRKRKILESRTKSTDLLRKYISEKTHDVKHFIGASAIGYYGMDTGEKLIHEDSEAGNDFLASVTKKWEKSVDQILYYNIPVTKIRIGVVLSAEGGALPQLTAPIKYGVGAALGSGKQYISWIHIDDLCRQFVFILENQLEGTFNGVGPKPVTNEKLTKVAAGILKKPLWLPNVPSFAMKALLGEMAAMVLGGNKVSSEKIENAGFKFSYASAKEALEDLLV